VIEQLETLLEKTGTLLIDRRFWTATGKWTAGLTVGTTLVIGAATIVMAFVASPWEWIGIMVIVPILGLVFGATTMLQYAPMADGEFQKRIWPVPAPVCNGEEWVHAEQ